MRLIRLILLTAATGLLVGCNSSSSSDQDASADTTPDGGADAGADGGVEAGDVGAPVEAGGPCTTNADCDLALLCGFPTSAGCSAAGVCISVFGGGCACDAGGALVCNCAGDLVTPSCCYPQGYQPFPLAPSDSCAAEGGTDGGTEAGGDGAIDASGD